MAFVRQEKNFHVWTSFSEEHNNSHIQIIICHNLYISEIDKYNNSHANNYSYVNSKAMKLFKVFTTGYCACFIDSGMNSK